MSEFETGLIYLSGVGVLAEPGPGPGRGSDRGPRSPGAGVPPDLGAGVPPNLGAGVPPDLGWPNTCSHDST